MTTPNRGTDEYIIVRRFNDWMLRYEVRLVQYADHRYPGTEDGVLVGFFVTKLGARRKVRLERRLRSSVVVWREHSQGVDKKATE